MVTLPSPPIFSFEPGPKGSFFMDETVSLTAAYTRLGLLSEEDRNVRHYDAAGQVWECVAKGPPMRRGLFSKLLAQLYNPSTQVDLTWTLVRRYAFDELQRAYIEAIGYDDDILTQFRDGEDIAKRIEECGDFGELVKVWEWANTDAPGEDSLDPD